MVKTPKTRHSKSRREPVTIELEPEAVSRTAQAQSAGEDKGVSEPADQAQSDVQPEVEAAGDAQSGSDMAQEESQSAGDGVESSADSSSQTYDYSFKDHAEAPDADKAKSDQWGDASGEHATMAAPAAVDGTGRKKGAMGGLAAGVIGGIIALAGAGALQFAGILGAPGTASSSVENLNSDVAALKAQMAQMAGSESGGEAAAKIGTISSTLDQVEAELATLKAAVETGSDGSDVTGLADKVQALETTIANLDQSGTAASVDLGPLDEKVGALEASVKSANDASAQQNERLAALEQSITALSAKVDAQASQPKIALAIAASTLKSALERGATFEAELETFAAISPDAPELASLRPYAEKGVPTRADIAASTDAAADAMIAATTPVDENAGFVQRLLSSAESLVKVRPIGAVEGTGVPEIVARMEASVKQGDYAKALSEYDTLPQEAKAAGEAFAAKLKARLDVEAKVDSLISGAMKA